MTAEPAVSRRDASWRRQARACAAAFSFLTRIPAGSWVRHDGSNLSASTIYFPIVGLVVGIAGAGALALGAALWPPTLATILSVGFTVWLTGAFHEDAL